MVVVRDAIVRDGRIVLDGLPFPDGQQVRVSVTALPVPVPDEAARVNAPATPMGPTDAQGEA